MNKLNSLLLVIIVIAITNIYSELKNKKLEHDVLKKNPWTDVFREASPSVLLVLTEKLGFDQQRSEIRFAPTDRNSSVQTELGSAIVIDNRGYLLTNAHLIKNVASITVYTADKKAYRAKVIGVDVATDIAIIQITPSNENEFVPMKFGDSDYVQVGNEVISIGYPLGIGQTVTSGIIGSTDKHFDNPYLSFLQTDAVTNKGNSGGALINSDGELIGINSYVVYALSTDAHSGLALAIPINRAVLISKDLIRFGKVRRGWIGNVSVSELALNHANEYDVNRGSLLVNWIESDSPLQKSGVRIEDIIIKVNGDPIDYNLLSSKLSTTRPGETIKFEIIRIDKNTNKRRHLQMSVTTTERPDNPFIQ